MGLRALATVALLLSACGDDAAPGVEDAGSDADTVDAGTGVSMPAAVEGPRRMPAPPELPSLTPCPAGWREVPPDSPDEIPTCDPWPATGRETCGAGEAHFPGEPGCRTVGTACPMDGWPAGLPPTAVLYVDDDAAAGGDGSRTTPFDTIGAAVAMAAAGMVVAVATGTYDETVDVPAGVEVRGACTAGTRVELSGAGTDAPLVIVGDGAAIRNLGVSSSRFGIAARRSTAATTLEDVVVDGATGGAVSVSGGSVTLRNVVARNTVPDVSGFGRGIDFGNAVVVRGDHVVSSRSQEAGLFAGADVDLRLTDVAIVDTAMTPGGNRFGIGVNAASGASARLERAIVAGSHSAGIGANVFGTTVTLVDSVVRDARATPRGFGFGVAAEGGADLALTRVLVERAVSGGVTEDGGHAGLQDVFIRDIEPSAAGENGRGFNVQNGTVTARRVMVRRVYDTGFSLSQTTGEVSDVSVRAVAVDSLGFGRGGQLQAGTMVTGERFLVEDVAGGGVLVGGFQTDVVLSDVVVRDTGTELLSVDTAGTALAAILAARLTARRVLVERYGQVGIGAAGSESFARFEDTVVREGLGLDDGTFGRGAVSQIGSRLELERVRITGAREFGIFVAESPSTASIADVSVVGTEPRAMDGLFGRGLHVQNGAVVDARRVLLHQNHEISAFVGTSASRLDAVDLTVTDTQGGLLDFFGRGACAQGGATMSIERALFERNREVSICAHTGGAVTVTDTVIRETLERACAETTCAGMGAGTGVGAYEGGATILLERFTIADNALIGIQIARSGALDASHGVVQGNPIGANVQIPDYDIDRIRDDVRYIDNDIGLDTTEIFVPEPSPGF